MIARKFKTALALPLAMVASTSVANAPSLSDWDAALGAVGLNTQTARFDPSMLSFYREGEFAMPIYEGLMGNPWNAPFLMDMHRRSLTVTVSNPLETVSVVSRLAGIPSRRELLGDPIVGAKTRAAAPGALAAILNTYRQQGIITGNVPSLDAVPADAQRATALMLDVLLTSQRFRAAALADINDIPAAYTRASRPEGAYDPVESARSRQLDRRIDRRYLAAAGQDLAAATEAAHLLMRTVDPQAQFRLEIPTKWGAIIVGGAGNDTYGGEPILLVMDTSGDDTYINAPATLSDQNWASISVDIRGKDKYVSDTALLTTEIAQWASRNAARGQAGPGGAVLGVTMLLDGEGDDLYRSHRMGLGGAVYGVSLLRDLAGKDTYDSYGDAQGFARAGAGILEDADGDDTYTGFIQVQGVGLTLGAGLLLDRSGDDRYTANDEVIDFPSPQTSEHNVSMSQGAGNGVRRDYLGGDSLAGGVGVLMDQGGNDEYSCGVFGQGVGYWMGAGLLWDQMGNDKYTGQWYVQGAAAHFAVGILEDGGGRDTYNGFLNMSQGAGHDFSVGALFDYAGSDAYSASPLSLGAGNANGIGIFFDAEGDDTYNAQGTALGNVNPAPVGSLREQALSLGVFLDFGGTDQFPAAVPHAVDGSRKGTFVRRGEPEPTGQYGVFWAR
ncbi:MAG TPA: hypothetical protein PLS15_02205 [Fimbriimonadaceae bacterium]|nr:hypothetical protein [Armatimonadota bacterium]HRD30486.1 hypothetical protein [Fimbriimonadaceae bacterium]HRE92854.1 hypothetical protein [Fimbriimonadaceae bacterium]